ncbi:WD40 repeat-like protein [Pleomassaria siparia CBS 279.74]|uniref:WD40 repeat-like protein n=1 Tax=Pleomassaria siparia CBS 279.74 TaxID=1314801 RepID=A0A6G1KIL6_9PLEO|nr:WD40 repeat-like protein [Pleomassaria siparia CBS 279.74]
MADTTDSLALKRKREGKVPQRKRNKTDKKSKASLGGTDGEDLATPVSITEIPDQSKVVPPSTLPPKDEQNGSVAKPNWRDKLLNRPKKDAELVKNGTPLDLTLKTSPSPIPVAEVEDTLKAPNKGAELESKSPRKRIRNRNKESNKKQGSEGIDEPIQTPKKGEEAHERNVLPTETDVSLKAERGDRSSTRQQGKSKHTGKKSPWSLSTPLGGWFLPQDPVFSPDEKFILLANTRSLQIYSIETSLLVTSLPVGSGALTTYALSSTKPNQVYIANSAGLITLWDWVDKKKIGRWDIGTNVRQIVVATQPGTTQDLIFCHEIGNSHVINVHALRTRDQKAQTEFKRIVKTKSPISKIEVLAGGNILVVACVNSVLIGRRATHQETALQDYEYTFREFTTSKRITTLSSYIQLQNPLGEGKRPSQRQKDSLDLAVGDESGVIHLFEDILSVSARIEKGQKKGETTNADLDSLQPKRLHWHRDAVGSVKWSLDGNYVISGGDETVLVIWQLSTGQQQHLPHLTAAIENIVVSPSGASYAVSLANNSVIVLSTTELEAKTNITGVQSRRVDMEQMPRESDFSHYSFDVFSQVPMAVDPKNNHQVIFSMPSSQPRHQTKRLYPEPYVQTFDLATQTPISRQALTRNNATDPNMGPDGRRIQEPNLKFLQISHDGNWLATVDEWHPSQTDMGFLEEGVPEFNKEERSFRRESYLKFWEWNEKSLQWALQSRIDAPHFFEDVGAVAQVLDLAPDPSGLGFATVGEDRVVRIWRPKTRTRNGVIVRGANKTNKEGVVTWSLDRSVELSSKLDVLESSTGPRYLSSPRNSRLAFSADGSVLAAGVSWSSDSDPGVIQIIDTLTGAVRRSITELDVIALSCLGIIGRHLVVIGDSVTVWDMVLDQVVYCLPFNFTDVDQLDTSTLVRLAIDNNNGTFAIACPQFEKHKDSKPRGVRYFRKATSRIAVFDPQVPKPIWSTTVPEIVLSLVSARDGKGYIMLDSSSSIRWISPKASALQLITPPPEIVEPGLTDEANGRQEDHMDSDESEMREIGNRLGTLTGSEELLNSENDKPVVRPEQLKAIFEDKPSHVLPPVRDLFDAVVGLYARKPRAVVTSV